MLVSAKDTFPDQQLTIVSAQNLSSFGILFNILDDVDQVRDLREERIVIWEPERLLKLITRATHVEHRLDIWVDQPKSLEGLRKSYYSNM